MHTNIKQRTKLCILMENTCRPINNVLWTEEFDVYHRHLGADCLENVRASKYHNPLDLHGL
jgi:hypothetical protein